MPPPRPHVGIYTIGLNDSSYKPGALKALAAAGNGQYAQAKAANLSRLFDRLSRLLSNEYVLQYKSNEGPGVPVQVAIDVKGVGAESTSYRTPLLPAGAIKPFDRRCSTAS